VVNALLGARELVEVGGRGELVEALCQNGGVSSNEIKILKRG
jgi:hypothetical protein